MREMPKTERDRECGRSLLRFTNRIKLIIFLITTRQTSRRSSPINANHDFPGNEREGVVILWAQLDADG